MQGGMRLLSGPPPSPISTNTPPNTHIPPPMRCLLLSFSKPMPCPCSSLSWLLLTSSTLSGLARWVVVGTACPPPAITALVTCAGAETTAARGLEDRGLEGSRTDDAAAGSRPLPASTVTLGDTRPVPPGVTLLLRHWRQWRQVATLTVCGRKQPPRTSAPPTPL